MARIDNAYAYYISTYAQKTVSRYDSHKKSELRKVYNKIVKINIRLFIKFRISPMRKNMP